MKVGILGGSFDPPHMGHLWLAIQAQETFNLDGFYFLPCSDQAAKAWGKEVTPAHHRLEMCQWLAAGRNNIHALSIEMDMGFEFTYQTVEWMLESTEWEIYWFVGSDWNPTQFKNYDQIKDKVQFVKVLRPPQTELDVKDEIPFTQPISFNLSSSILRKRLRERREIVGLTAPMVLQHISENGLYPCNE